MDNPASAFVDAQSVDYAAVAKTVAGIKPRALTPPQFEDVVSLIEWMQSECVAMHEFNAKRTVELDAREKALVQREKDLQVRMRTVNVASMTKVAGSRFSRYFRG